MEFIQIANNLSTTHLKNHHNDDMWIDRLSHRYSVVVFTIFAILVTSKAYIGDPIDCWAPPEFKSSYERYAETLCFVNGTYHISVNELDIPIDTKNRYANRIRYYQWTPFILLLQAFLMYFPRFIWISLNSKYGLNLRNLVDAAKKYESVDGNDNREKILVYMCKNLLRAIQYKEAYKLNKKNLSNDNFTSEALFLKNNKELNKMLTMHNQQQQQQQQQHITLTTPLTIYENEIKKNKKSKRSHKHKLLSNNHQENENYSKLDTNNKKQHLITINNFDDNNNNDDEEESLNLLRARINTISRKHLLNVFSSGYERTNQSVNDGKILDHHHHHQQQQYNSSSFLNKLKSIKLLPDLNNNFLTYLYIFVKLLYLLSSIGQVLILNRLIGNNFYMLGINLITSFFFEQEWPHLAIFPRISFFIFFRTRMASLSYLSKNFIV